jgi:hypothetical protein
VQPVGAVAELVESARLASALDTLHVWESLVSTAVGGVVAAAAGAVAMMIQSRQTARLRREQHEREDRYRLHQARVEAYLDFHTSASRTRAALQDFNSASGEDDVLRREARNATHLTYVRIALIGGTAVVASARRMMIHIDDITFGRTVFDASAWSNTLDEFQQTARQDLTGQRDLAAVTAQIDWLPPTPRPRSDLP